MSAGCRSGLPFAAGCAVAGVAAVLLDTVRHATSFPTTGTEAALAVYVMGGVAVGVFRPAWWQWATIGVLACSLIAPWVAALSGAGGLLRMMIYPHVFLTMPVLVTLLFAAAVALARVLVWAMRWPPSRASDS